MPKSSPLFLERQNYRIRRFVDALRLVPIMGIILWFFPVVISHDTKNAPMVGFSMLYIFGVWILLIVTAFFISRKLKRSTHIWDALETVQNSDD